MAILFHLAERCDLGQRSYFYLRSVSLRSHGDRQVLVEAR